MIRVGASSQYLLVGAVMALLFSGAPWAQAEQQYSAFGLVLEVNGPNKFVVSCKETPGFMDAMVMPFEVRGSGDLRAIRPGMLVDFTVVVDSGIPYAKEIKVHQFERPEQRTLEVQMLKMIGRSFGAKPSAEQMLAVDQKVPDFNLVDQHRRPVKFSDWSGKVVAISFVYTRCSFPEYCFRLSNNLGLVGKRFADRMGQDSVLLTISFDPTSDSPEVLSNYAQTWKASGKGWYSSPGLPQK